VSIPLFGHISDRIGRKKMRFHTARVIFVGGDRGQGPVYVRSISGRVEILCTAVKDAKCQKQSSHRF